MSDSESSTQRVARWLDDVRLLNEERHALVQALRSAVLSLGPSVTEEVKYGGLLFSTGSAFCGIFSYRAHVSLEFGQGAALSDPAGVLEGAGKGRRHIKLRHLDDVARCRVAEYLQQAFARAQAAG